jgi:hypothetical protein
VDEQIEKRHVGQKRRSLQTSGQALLRVAAASPSQRSQEKIKTFFKPSTCRTVISRQPKVLGAFGPDTCGIAASHNGDSARLFQDCCRAEGKHMSDVFVLVLTVICLGGELFLLDLFNMLIE